MIFACSRRARPFPLAPFLTGCLLGLMPLQAAAQVQVLLEKVPEGGVQPQVACDREGRVHLVYLLGEAAEGCEVRYTRRLGDGLGWEPSRTVNREPRSAVAMGTIRGARLALGREGSVQVVWNGRATPGQGRASPLWHARLEPGDARFSPQTDLLAGTEALDGGADVTADGQGRVSVVWHGQRPAAQGEGSRLLFARHSGDDGRSFGPLTALNETAPGVCACCSLSARLLPEGSLGVLYRGATPSDQRGMVWLTQANGKPARLQRLDAWKLKACPMSSAALLSSETASPLLAWENAGRIRLARLPFRAEAVRTLDLSNARHPALAQNAAGQVLVACARGSAWAKAGQLEWRLLDASLEHTLAASTASPRLPVWSFPTAFAQPDGRFIVLH